MGYQRKVKFWPNERLDLPDVNLSQDNVYDFLGRINRRFISGERYIVSGFIVQNNGGLDIKVEVKDSVAMNIESSVVGVEGIMWVGTGNISIDTDLINTLTNNATNYIELELYEEESAPDTRAFWDPTANAGQGDEYTQVVNTCVNIKCRLRINTIAFSGNSNYIPISRVITSAGNIATIYDERPLFFRLNSDYGWLSGRTPPSNQQFSGGDKSLAYMKEWMDAVMTTLKELKGSEWYEELFGNPSLQDLLEDKNVVLSITGGIEFNSTTGVLNWTSPITIMVPNESFDFTIPIGSVTSISDQDVLYVTFDRTGVSPTLSIVKVANGSLPLHKDNYVIGYREGDTFVLRDGRNVARVWVYEENIWVDTVYNVGDEITLPVDSRNSGATKSYRNGRGELQYYINGVQQQRNPVLLSSTFQPSSYNSGTGVVLVPDGVDLSWVTKEDVFRDAVNNEFSIIGNVSNTTGSKQFRIATGQTVDVGNGAVLFRQDYYEFGSYNAWVEKIVTRKSIPAGAMITFRIEPLTTLGGGVGGGTGGGGGGSQTLQDTYDLGRTITTTAGNPFEVFGPVGQKIAKFNGDIDVTGIIDPKAIVFDRQTSDPIPSGQDGIWIDLSGNVYIKNKDTGNSQLNDQVSTTKNYTNNTGDQLSRGRVVTKNGAGSIKYADWTTELSSRGIGVLLTDLTNDASGPVKTYGYISSGTIEASDFIEGSLPEDGSRIYLGQEDGKLTVIPPTTGSGHWELFMGIWDDGGLNLQIALIGKS